MLKITLKAILSLNTSGSNDDFSFDGKNMAGTDNADIGKEVKNLSKAKNIKELSKSKK